MVRDTLISIVVPAYNAQKHIGLLLDSIISQTYKNFEVICIDDGSADDTKSVIEQYIKKDSRIKYIYQENAGVSAARNNGLKISNGDYICFYDADDFIAENTLEILLNEAQNNDADIVSCGYYIYYNENKKFPMLNTCNKLIDRDEALKLILDNKVLGMSACNKLYKKEILYDVEFPEDMRINEDRFFSFIAVSHAEKIKVIDNLLYFYRMNSDSVTHKIFNEKNLDSIVISERMAEIIEKRFPKLELDAYANIVRIRYHLLTQLYKDNACDDFKDFYKDTVKWLKKCNLNSVKHKMSKSIYMQILAVKYCEPVLKMVKSKYMNIK